MKVKVHDCIFIGKDSCNGDSGGPLLSQRGTDFKNTKYLVGIVSFGTYRCAEGYPGVYTSIEYYLSWIERNMETFGGSRITTTTTTTTKVHFFKLPTEIHISSSTSQSFYLPPDLFLSVSLAQ